MPIPHRRLARLLAFAALALAASLSTHALPAQEKGEPGKFDFYLMNLAAGSDFCHVPGAGPACKPPRGFVLHGLWTQNNDGTYPVNCSTEPGPAGYTRFLDLTPDLPLLQHEWEKHGTCTALGPERFFRMERRAHAMLRLPPELRESEPPKQPGAERTLTTAGLLGDFYRINPGFPPGSLLLSCKQGKLTAVEACFSKDLKPIRCRSLPTCADRTVTVAPAP